MRVKLVGVCALAALALAACNNQKTTSAPASNAAPAASEPAAPAEPTTPPAANSGTTDQGTTDQGTTEGTESAPAGGDTSTPAPANGAQ